MGRTIVEFLVRTGQWSSILICLSTYDVFIEIEDNKVAIVSLE